MELPIVACGFQSQSSGDVLKLSPGALEELAEHPRSLSIEGASSFPAAAARLLGVTPDKMYCYARGNNIVAARLREPSSLFSKYSMDYNLWVEFEPDDPFLAEAVVAFGGSSSFNFHAERIHVELKTPDGKLVPVVDSRQRFLSADFTHLPTMLRSLPSDVISSDLVEALVCGSRWVKSKRWNELVVEANTADGYVVTLRMLLYHEGGVAVDVAGRGLLPEVWRRFEGLLELSENNKTTEVDSDEYLMGLRGTDPMVPWMTPAEEPAKRVYDEEVVDLIDNDDVEHRMFNLGFVDVELRGKGWREICLRADEEVVEKDYFKTLLKRLEKEGVNVLVKTRPSPPVNSRVLINRYARDHGSELFVPCDFQSPMDVESYVPKPGSEELVEITFSVTPEWSTLDHFVELTKQLREQGVVVKLNVRDAA